MKDRNRRIYEFGPYTFKPESCTLLKGTERVTISGNPFELLHFFVQHPNVAVTPDELSVAIWPGMTRVETANIYRQIYTVRRILGKTPDSRDYIKVIRGKAYIFQAEVRETLAEDPQSACAVPTQNVQMAPSAIPQEVEAIPTESLQPPDALAVEGPQVVPIPEVATEVPEPRSDSEQLSRRWSKSAIACIIGVAAILVGCYFWSKQHKPTISRVAAAATTPTQGPNFYESGLQKLQSGNTLDARKLLEQAVTLDPQYGPAHSALSQALLELGYETRAKEEAKRGTEMTEGLGREEVLLVKAQFYASSNDWASAARAYETLFSLFPDKLDYGVRYSLALSKEGKEGEALAVMKDLKAAGSPDHPVLDLGEALVADDSNDYRGEYTAAAQAERKARAKQLPYMVGRAELSEAWALDNLSDLKQAELKARDAQLVLAGLKDIGGEGRAWKDLGDVYIDEQRPEEATAAYKHAISAFRQTSWKSGEAVALNNLGYVLRDCGDYAGARELFKQSLRISKSLGDLRRQAMALNGIAVVLKRSGNLSGAEEANRAALEIHRQLKDDAKYATALNDLAIVLQDQGKLLEAEQAFKESLGTFDRLGRQIDVAMLHGNFGDLALRCGDLSRAEKEYHIQVEMGNRIPQPKQLGYGLYGLGEVSFWRYELTAAKRYLAESLRLRTGMHDAGTVAETRLALAEVFLEEHNFADAETNARSAAAEFGHERQVDQQAVSEAVLSRALLREQKSSEALGLADKSLQRLSSSEDKDSEMAAKLEVSKVLDACGRRTQAIKLLESVAEEAAHSKYLPCLLEARAALARISLESGAKSAEHEMQLVKTEASAKGLLLIARRMDSSLSLAASNR